MEEGWEDELLRALNKHSFDGFGKFPVMYIYGLICSFKWPEVRHGGGPLLRLLEKSTFARKQGLYILYY
ncbi:hypothetical protein L484_020854 [Morus notabilis]|uniref:Uncharacterized protein n=1 Tax=Morus notabilis TaxID=981085 RepID=W9QRM2_9ROSA|nr:hypothetical protein L484_020854 [Morus notabilis]